MLVVYWKIHRITPSLQIQHKYTHSIIIAGSELWAQEIPDTIILDPFLLKFEFIEAINPHFPCPKFEIYDNPCLLVRARP